MEIKGNKGDRPKLGALGVGALGDTHKRALGSTWGGSTWREHLGTPTNRKLSYPVLRHLLLNVFFFFGKSLLIALIEKKSIVFT